VIRKSGSFLLNREYNFRTVTDIEGIGQSECATVFRFIVEYSYEPKHRVMKRFSNHVYVY